jgi:hypothetical protein
VRSDLHFKIGCGDEELSVAMLDKHIRENWQRVPAFDDSRNGLQRPQQRVASELF